MTVSTPFPHDILPDDTDEIEINGITARKGTIAAVLANATIIESHSSSEALKQKALNTIEQLAPVVIAVGLMDHLTWNNKRIQDIFDQALSTLPKGS